ncbi:MAG: TIGR01777 family protein [Candidatus Nitrosocosmicus sp.]|nr:TIGR01777 family protein [Candidatus Nitrosocosmicus sp.]
MVNENFSDMFVKRSLIPCDVNTLFDYHKQNGALERLVPPWSGLNVVSQKDGINNDAISIFRIEFGPIRLKWVSKHFGYIHNKQFQDKMIKGPFKKWVHTHSFIPQDENQCIIEDRINYTPKFGQIGSKILHKNIQNYLNQLFIYRYRILVDDINLKKRTVGKGKKILITGSHGLIGSALIPLLTNIGEHKVTRLARGSSNKIKDFPSNTDKQQEVIYWDLESKKLNLRELENFDIIIHLSGENIFGRWTNTKKRRILDSRVQSTILLSESLSKLSNPPSLLICASAIGYYGNRPNEILTEESSSGDGFLSKVCQEWENATKTATKAGIRVVNTRFGVVLCPKEGMLQKLLPPFKMGLGVSIGNKEHYINWVSIEDVIKSIFYLITDDSIHGPVNIVSPNLVTNMEFSNILNKIFNPKLSISINPKITKIIFGQMADELLSTNSHVLPKKLLKKGYKFVNPDLEETVRFLVGKMQVE